VFLEKWHFCANFVTIKQVIHQKTKTLDIILTPWAMANFRISTIFGFLGSVCRIICSFLVVYLPILPQLKKLFTTV